MMLDAGPKAPQPPESPKSALPLLQDDASQEASLMKFKQPGIAINTKALKKDK
jgi:hypothetical protein